MKYCASCKNGEIKREADYLVKGKIPNENSFGPAMIPYRAYLCEDHLEAKIEGGAELEIIEYLSQEAKDNHAKEILQTSTMWKTTEEFLNSNPTIRRGSFPDASWLRRYYREINGVTPAN